MKHLTRAEVRDLDRQAIEEFGLPGIVLMENAGRGATERLLSAGVSGRVVVCCGKGNNGGDGFVIARHLESLGVAVQVLLFAEFDEVQGDACVNLGVLRKAGTPLRMITEMSTGGNLEDHFANAEWIVDALLGTGTRGPVREPYAGVIEAMNRSDARLLSVDLPSGLDCDTGEAPGACVRAELTVTFVAPKVGFAAPGAAEFTGDIQVVDIGLPRRMLTSVTL